MVESLLILFRETLEAALVVAIVLAYLRQLGRQDMFTAVWVGVGGAVAVSVAAGVLLSAVFGGLEGSARMLAFGAVSFAAAGVLTWMIFWMRRQARHIGGELRSQVDAAVMTGSTFGVAALAFFAVAREGLETVLFLLAAATDGFDSGTVLGGLAGVVIASTLGYLVYRGGRTIPLSTFFRLTGFALIVFAAGLAAKGVFFLQAAGVLGTANDAVYDITSISWLTVETQVGRLLSGLFGWDPRPSIEQVAMYLAYFIPVGFLFLRTPRPAAAASSSAAATPSAA